MHSKPFTFYRSLRCYFRLALLFICFLVYVFILILIFLALIFQKADYRKRIFSRVTQLFDCCLLWIMNIKTKVLGPHTLFSSDGQGAFLVSNHLGYVDGLVLGALFPVVYVGKAEMKKWPLIGLMSEISGTIFIDRQKKNHIAEYIEVMAGVLQGGANILFFPEGTSTNGEMLLPFKSSFFEAPLMTAAPVAPISLIYRSIDGAPVTKENRDSVYWYGDMTFADHLFRLLFFDRIEVEVKIHPPIILKETQDKNALRKRLSELANEAIRKDIYLIKPS